MVEAARGVLGVPVLCVCAGVLLLCVDAAQGRRALEDPLVGTWAWKYAAPGEKLATHGTVTFSSDGTMRWSGGNSGTWRHSRTTVTLTWSGGTKTVDTLTLSADGSTLTGSNNSGWTVQGIRHGTSQGNVSGKNAAPAGSFCVGDCSTSQLTAVQTLDPGRTGTVVGIGCGGGTPPRVTASATYAGEGGSCSVQVTTTVAPAQLTTLGDQIAADAAKQQMERWKILRDVQEKINEITQDVTVNKARTADRAYKKWDEYIRDSTDPADDKKLRQTDSELAPRFRAKGVRVPSSALRTTTAMPDVSRVLRSIYDARPTSADAAAFKAALDLATAPTYSRARAEARLTVLAAVVIGRPLLERDVVAAVGTGQELVLGSAHAVVPATGARTLNVPSSALGGRVLRLLTVVGLSQPTKEVLEVSVTRNGTTATTTKSLRIG